MNNFDALSLKAAQDSLAAYKALSTTMPNSPQLMTMIAEAQAKVDRLTPPQPQLAAATGAATETMKPLELGEYLKGHDQRIAALEQLVQKVAAPVINEAAQTGAMMMAALGEAMSADQAEWVKSKLETSPEFFATPDCHEAVALFIAEWRNFEERKAAK